MRADLGKDKNLLRFNLMDEENNEYLEAAKNNDLIEVADALGDMLYIFMWNNFWSMECNIKLRLFLKKFNAVI